MATTNSIHDAFINALLADVAYVNLIDPNGNLFTGPELLNELGKRLTPALANYFVQHFEVVRQIDTDDILGSGFDATVFKSKDPGGQYYVSMRGTEPIFADIASKRRVGKAIACPRGHSPKSPSSFIFLPPQLSGKSPASTYR
jgi:hypothetical protein